MASTIIIAKVAIGRSRTCLVMK